ncbi:MAG: immunoglobulin domain-containing protein, partial [Parasporobacterium sp.]|nr:immunoglobulin domain-containing protein [Parasporobacterium sp.]
ATGDQLTYQWQKKVSGGSWVNAGTNSASFTIANASPSDNGTKVKCIVTDKYGDQITSNEATLTVSYTQLAITKNLTDKRTATDEPALFAVTAQGDQLSYQWQKKVSGGSWTNTGTNAASYTIQSVQVADDGTMVRCIITDKYGEQVISNEVTLTVGYTPLEIIQNLSDVTVNRGEDVVFSITAVGDGLTYRWYLKESGGSWFSVGDNLPEFTLTNVSPEDNGKMVKCVVHDKYDNDTNSVYAHVTVNYTPLEITKNISDVNVNRGEDVTFSITAAGDGLIYGWQVKEPDSGWEPVGDNSPAFAIADITPEYDGAMVKCIVWDKYGDSVNSVYAHVTVNYTPLSITTNPSNKTVARGTAAQFTIAATGDQLTYQWQKKV